MVALLKRVCVACATVGRRMTMRPASSMTWHCHHRPRHGGDYPLNFVSHSGSSLQHFYLLLSLLLIVPYRAIGHDIPKDVAVQAFLKPEGQRLHLLVRVPLGSMRDVDFPEREGGYLDSVKLP